MSCSGDGTLCLGRIIGTTYGSGGTGAQIHFYTPEQVSAFDLRCKSFRAWVKREIFGMAAMPIFLWCGNDFNEDSLAWMIRRLILLSGYNRG